MKILPDYQLSVLSEEEYPEKMAAISEQLDQCRQEGTFSGFDGKELYYEYFLAQESRGAVVVVHGLSEFTKKYHEFAWYLLNQGFDVFLYDQRCHGRSCRLTPWQDVIHVDHFSHYHKDLHCFVQNVVRKATHKPLYLFSHSMGGAVSAQYLALHPQVFQKAVLSAPMIEPLTGETPAIVARWGLSAYTLFSKGKKKFWFSGEFDPNYPFERAQDKSYARFRRNMDIRLSDDRYHTTPLSIRWVQQSVVQRYQLTRKNFLKKIRTPILMLSAQNDTVVCGKAQAKFAKKCSVCRQVILADAHHGTLCAPQQTLQELMELTLDHFV